MEQAECIELLDRSLAKNRPVVIAVNCESLDTYNELCGLYHYRSGSKTVRACEFAKKDFLPQDDVLLDRVRQNTEILFLEDLTLFWFLKGNDYTKKCIKNLISLEVNNPVVLFTCQCAGLLRELVQNDTRLSEQIYLIRENRVPLPSLTFAAPELTLKEKYTDGMDLLAQALRENPTRKNILIQTKRKKSLYRDSLYGITELNSAHDLLARGWSRTPEQALGNEEEWRFALEQVRGAGGWDRAVENLFDSPHALRNFFPRCQTTDEKTRWFYFLAMKMYGVGEKDAALKLAIERSGSFPEVISHLYRDIQEIDPRSSNFQKFYANRKEILNDLGDPEHEAAEFCGELTRYGKNGVEYLTDNTRAEKEKVLWFLTQFREEFLKPERLRPLLRRVYPDLAAYLEEWAFEQSYLTEYFSAYKRQKVFNQIEPEFLDLVQKQAEEREYNSLPARSELIEDLPQKGSCVFFMDAMGVEYLSFIRSLCQEYKLSFDVKICRCNLPSITSMNKDFLTYFESKAIQIRQNKELDRIKHNTDSGMNTGKNELPLHLVRELETIRGQIKAIHDDLYGRKFEQALLISDHGASRPAVLHNSENRITMAEPGKHSGRCCRKSESDIRPDFAAEEQDFWVLANYDRFKGSRKADVEVHGGAALEEVVIPIITIRPGAEKPALTVHLSEPNAPNGEKKAGIPRLKTSPKKPASVLLTLSAPVDRPYLTINGERYYADEEACGENVYSVTLNGLKRGCYDVSVSSGTHEILAEGLKLEIINAIGQTNKDFL